STGAPGRTRTCNHRLRRPVLYPVELRAPANILPAPLDGRGRGIRTPDPLVPNQMRYQTALCPDPGLRCTPLPRKAGHFGCAPRRCQRVRAPASGPKPGPCMLAAGTHYNNPRGIPMIRSGNPALKESTFLDLGSGAIVRDDGNV